jgi:hypothetical protein
LAPSFAMLRIPSLRGLRLFNHSGKLRNFF